MAFLEGKAPNLLAAVLTLMILGGLALPLRIYVRVTERTFGREDWCALVATIPWLGLSIVCIGCAFAGIGANEEDLTHAEITTALRWFWLFEIFWCMAVIPVKLSISLMLGRIAIVKRPLVIGLYVLSTLLTIITLVGLFYIVFRCTPVSYAWDQSIPGGSCQPNNVLAYVYYVTTAINIAMDWYCALIPVVILWNAPLPRREKLSISLLLGMGVLASISACVRQVYTSALTKGTHDSIDTFADLVIWGYAEPAIGFLAASLSTLRPLFWRRRNDDYTDSQKSDEDDLDMHHEMQRVRTASDDAVEMEGMSPTSKEVEEQFHWCATPSLPSLPENIGKAI